MLENIDGILFDLDGTLLDTAPDLINCLNILLEKYSKKSLSEEILRPFVALGSRGLIEYGFNMTTKHPEYAGLRQEYLQTYLENINHKTRLFPGISDVLSHLQQCQKKWGIVTNKPEFLTNKLIPTIAWNYPPMCLVAVNETIRPKPAPDGLLTACQLLNLKPEHCLYVGDAKEDVIAARSVNMSVITALYGYLGPDANPKEWQADYYINSPGALLNLFI